MAGLQITIDDSKLQRELKKISDQLKDFKEALKLIGEEVDEVIDRAFASRASPDGTPWKPWSETTKRVHGTGGSLLNRTGRLKRAIRVTVSNNHEVIIEVRSPYAATHQFGFPGNKAWGRGSAPIPARKFLPVRSITDLDPEMIERIETILAEHFEVS